MCFAGLDVASTSIDDVRSFFGARFVDVTPTNLGTHISLGLRSNVFHSLGFLSLSPLFCVGLSGPP